MTRVPDPPGQAPERTGPGPWSRFIGGIALGALETIVFIAAAKAVDELGLTFLVALMVGNGVAAGLRGGPPMLVGTWLGVALPLLVLAIAVGPACYPAPFPIPGCPQGLYLALAAVALVAVPIIEVAGYVAGRLVRWAVFDPTGEESGPSAR